MAHTHDAIIIGSGQSGKPLATALAKAGRNVAIIERRHVGGSCINYGCTPTKAMAASARATYLVRRAADYGVRDGAGVSVDFAAVRQRKDEIVMRFRAAGRRALEEADRVELLFGAARFADNRRIIVALNEGGTRELSAPCIVIDTGGRPALPPISGLTDARPLDSTSVMELSELPAHLVVLGGGYIGLEFGQMFRRFGSRVTIIDASPRVISKEDDDVADAVGAILREDGIELVLGAQIEQVKRTRTGVEVKASHSAGATTISGSHVLAALGRAPNTADLDLGKAGIETDEKGYIQVNPRLETNVPGIYAVGDVKGGPAFTHISYDDYRVLKANLLEGRDATIEGRLVPNTVYIDPQLGTVGINEKQARADGRRVRVARLPMDQVARAREVSETRGFMKAIVDAGDGQILGCAVLGIEGGEIMSMLQIAMMAGLPYTALKEGIFAHPTLAESLNNLFLALDA